MVVFVLWLFTSAYAIEVGAFPSAESCAMVALQLGASFDAPPKPFLYRLACVPALRSVPQMMRPTAPPVMGPGA